MRLAAMTLCVAGAVVVGGGIVPLDEAGADRKQPKACCKVTYDGDKAVATGTLRYPRDAKLLYVGMDPPIGACAYRAAAGRVQVRKEFDLDRTERGLFRFSYVFKWKGEVRTRTSPRFLVKGRAG